MKVLQTIVLSYSCLALSGCMSQESATKQAAHEFVEEFPNHPKTEIYDRVVKWMSKSPKPAGHLNEYQNRDAGSIVRGGDTQITPEGAGVNMRIGFTMSIDVKNDRMRVRFTQLRRLYGSKKYDQAPDDDFFSSPTAVPYQRAAQARFAILVKSLNDFIVQGTENVAIRQ